MIDGIESKDEGSDDEGEPMKNDFCWSDFEEFEDTKNIVNNISDPYELKELIIDPDKITIDPLSASLIWTLTMVPIPPHLALTNLLALLRPEGAK